MIATPDTGRIVEHGVSGFIVPIRDPDAITAALERLMIEPGLLDQFKRGALLRSLEGSLEAYGQRLLHVLTN